MMPSEGLGARRCVQAAQALIFIVIVYAHARTGELKLWSRAQLKRACSRS